MCYLQAMELGLNYHLNCFSHNLFQCPSLKNAVSVVTNCWLKCNENFFVCIILQFIKLVLETPPKIRTFLGLTSCLNTIGKRALPNRSDDFYWVRSLFKLQDYYSLRSQNVGLAFCLMTRLYRKRPSMESKSYPKPMSQAR